MIPVISVIGHHGAFPTTFSHEPLPRVGNILCSRGHDISKSDGEAHRPAMPAPDEVTGRQRRTHPTTSPACRPVLVYHAFPRCVWDMESLNYSFRRFRVLAWPANDLTVEVFRAFTATWSGVYIFCWHSCCFWCHWHIDVMRTIPRKDLNVRGQTSAGPCTSRSGLVTRSRSSRTQRNGLFLYINFHQTFHTTIRNS